MVRSRTAVRLVAALGWYWWLRSMKIEGAELIAEAVDVPGVAQTADIEQLAVAYAMGALLAADTPRADRAREWFQLAVDLAGRIPDPDNPVLRLIGPVGALGGFGSELGSARPEIFDEAVDDPHPWVRTIARILRAHTALNLGRLHAQAEADFLAVTRMSDVTGDRWSRAVALDGLASLEGRRGEHAAAADHYRQAAELAAGLGTAEDEMHFRCFLARELWLIGERDQARTELIQAQSGAERLGLPHVLALAACTAGDLARLDGDREAARNALTRAEGLAAEPGGVPQIRALIATALGYLAGAEGHLDAARRWHAKALDIARASADSPVIAQALIGLADLALREGDPERAAELLGASFAIRGTTDRSVPDEERVAGQARSVLGGARYGEVYQRGQRVTIDALPALIPLTPGA